MSKIQKLRKEAIKFQNLAEHSKIFSRTVRSQEQLQNDLLAVIEEQKKLTDEINKKSVLLDEERKEIALIRESLINSESALSKREADFLFLKTSTEEAIQQKIREATDIESNSRSNVSKLAQELINLEKAISVTKDDLNAIEGQFQANKSTYEAELSRLTEKISNSLAKITSLDQKKSILVKELEHLNIKIKEADDRFASSFDKEATFLYNLNDKDKELKKKEKSLAVYSARLKALYKREFNKEIKI